MIRYISFVVYTPTSTEDHGCSMICGPADRNAAFNCYDQALRSWLNTSSGGYFEELLATSNNARAYLVGLDTESELYARYLAIDDLHTSEQAAASAQVINDIIINLETATQFALCTYLHKSLIVNTMPQPSSCSRCHKATKVYTALTGEQYCDACWPVYLAENTSTGLADAEFIYSIYEDRMDASLFTKGELNSLAKGWAVARHDNQLKQNEAELDAIEADVKTKYKAVYSGADLDFTYPY